MTEKKIDKLVAIGCSAGGLAALSFMLEQLPHGFELPMVIIQHRSRDQNTLLETTLQHKTKVGIKQADEKEALVKGRIYIAPPGYHLLLEDDCTFSLSMEDEPRYSRPSIDVFFETAAAVLQQHFTAIVLTGASNDGSAGITATHEAGGTTIAQDPTEAAYPIMPRSAIETGHVQQVLRLSQIVTYLIAQDHEYKQH